MKTSRCRILILTVLLTTPIHPVSAASLTAGELPVSVRVALERGEIQMNFVDGVLQSAVSGGGISAYAYTRGGVPYMLVEYSVLPGSTWSNSINNTADLSGAVFLSVPVYFNEALFDGVEIPIFFDQLVPDVGSGFFFPGEAPDPLQVTMVLENSAMTAGSGYYHLSGEPDYLESGNMGFGGPFTNPFFFCIECAFTAQLDLVFLDYSNTLLQFNFDDPRTTLLNMFDSYETSPYGFGLNLVVNQVPLPATLPLFVSALFALAIRRR
ncbi:MAG: hypothetical protein OEQ74_01460 [Gammaproteobacteria bacterium]|nr:hypothetical protein [Gammaproteobacteria bacterium]